MGLKQEGYPARDYGNHRPTIRVRLYEGALSFKDTGFDEFGRPNPDWSTAAPMHIGQYVVLHEDSTPRDIIVEPAESASEAIGKLVVNPEVESGGLGWTDDEQNILPRANKDWGEFVPRGGTCEFFGAAIDELKVVEDNDAIAAGDYLDAEDDELFSASTDPTNWIALSAVGALKGGFIPALALK